MEYKKNPFSLKLNYSVVNEIYQRYLKKKYYLCALTSIYFCPTEAENFPSKDDRWIHISFDMADKCDIYLRNSLKKKKCTFLNLRKVSLIFKDEKFAPVFKLQV